MSRLTSRSRSLLVLLCLALAVCGRVGAHQVRGNPLAERQLLPIGSTTSGGGEATTTANTGTTTSTQNTNTGTTTTQQTTATQTTTNNQETTQNTQNTGTSTRSTNTQQNTQTTGTTGTTTQPQNTQTTTQEPPQPTDSVLSTVDANGSTVVVTTFFTPSATDSSTESASASQSAEADNSDGGGISTGSIIGMSVAGGIAVIGVVAFFIWKFTRKRYTDFDDEPIKWPELNSHNNDNLNYALPTDRAKTGAGAGLDSASEVNLDRNVSTAGYSQYSQPSQYTHPTAADSTADLYAPGGDPYAVPPLPHLNPNQPYRDDPGYGGGYYDPYRGPVPQTFNDTASVHSANQHGGEAIPMNNLGVAQAGRRSPGPQMGLDMGQRAVSPQPPMAGRQSPGPSLAYAGRTTPGAGPALTGGHSPGPGAAYGGGY